MPNIDDLIYTPLSDQEAQKIFKRSYLRYNIAAWNFLRRFPQKTLSKRLFLQIRNFYALLQKYNCNNTSYFFDALQKARTYTDIEKTYYELKGAFAETEAEINKVVKAGILLRHLRQTQLPEIFKKTGRVYLKIKPIPGEKMLLTDTLSLLNRFLPLEQAIYITEKAGQTASRYLFKQGKTTFKPGRYLNKIYMQATQIGKHLKTLPIEARDDFKSTILEAPQNTKKLGALLKEKQLSPIAHLDEFLINYLKFECTNTDVLTALNTLAFFLKKKKDLLHSYQIKEAVSPQGTDENKIDMLILSARPRDVALASTYVDWEKYNCINIKNGVNYPDLIRQIGAGCIVAYAVNSQHPEKKLARVMLKPFLTKKTLRLAAASFIKNAKNIGLTPWNPLTEFNTAPRERWKEYEAEINNFLNDTTHINIAQSIQNLPIKEGYSYQIYKSDKIYGSAPDSLRPLLDKIATTLFDNPLPRKTSYVMADTLYIDKLKGMYKDYQPPLKTAHERE